MSHLIPLVLLWIPRRWISSRTSSPSNGRDEPESEPVGEHVVLNPLAHLAQLDPRQEATMCAPNRRRDHRTATTDSTTVQHSIARILRL